MALAYPLRTLWVRTETCELDDVFPPDDLGSALYTPFIIYMPYIIAAI